MTLIADDTSDYQAARRDAHDTAVRKSPFLGSSAEVPAIADEDEADSDFELTPSSVIDAAQPDSGSDFELSASEEPSDEFRSDSDARPERLRMSPPPIRASPASTCRGRATRGSTCKWPPAWA